MGSATNIKPLQLVTLVAALLILSAIPRFFELDRLGFFGDEEITSTAAKYLYLEGETRQQSGMPYSRATLHSRANTLFLDDTNISDEAPYRYVSAITGTLFIILLYFAIKPFIGSASAAICALLLALSDWHITLSREARMYGPFLITFTLAALSLWRWQLTGKVVFAILGLVLAMVTVNLHVMGVLLSVYCVIPSLIKPAEPRQTGGALLMAVFILAFTILHERLVKSAFREWRQSIDHSSSAVLDAKTTMLNLPDLILNAHMASYVLVLGAFLIGLAAFKYRPMKSMLGLHSIAWPITYCTMLVFAGFGQLYGFALLFACLLLQTPKPANFIRKHIWLFAFPCIIAAIGSALNLYTYGGITKLLFVPFPYLLMFAKQYPLLTVLFLAGVTWGVLRDDYTLRLLSLGALIPFIAIGLGIESWHDIRYIIAAYVFMLAIVAVTLSRSIGQLVKLIGSKPRDKTAFALSAVCVCLLIGGHNILSAHHAATLSYGDLIPGKLWPYPDHKGAGAYVKTNFREGDIVIAEDAIQQGWYVGQVDYWLRSEESTKKSFYYDKNMQARNTYTHALGFMPHHHTSLMNSNKRIWLITSAETRAYWEYNLSAFQLEWLKSVRTTAKPAYIGRDGLTEVFLISSKNEN